MVTKDGAASPVLTWLGGVVKVSLPPLALPTTSHKTNSGNDSKQTAGPSLFSLHKGDTFGPRFKIQD